MTDRFDAQLRQHLLENANERAADGQVASIVEGVATTGQRHPLAARLTWFPGRIGPFPAMAVRYGLVAAALLAAMAAALIFASGGPGRPVSFEGTWIATDVPDGSRMTLVVAAGDRPAVHYEDAVATGGACDDTVVKRFIAEGTGEISGSRLVVEYPDGGGCDTAVVGIDPMTFDYEAGRDTLRAQDGIVWFRVRGGEVPSTPPNGPASEQPSTDFEGTWTATDVPDGSGLSLVVGPGNSPPVHFEDDFATGDACVDDEVKVFTANGNGSISDGSLEVFYPDGGGCGTTVVSIAGSYRYRPGSDTLVDQDNVLWHRIRDDIPGSSGAPPTDAPFSPDPNRPFAFVPLPTYTCDLTDGTYGGHFESTLVTIRTPRTWHALDTDFHAEDDSCGLGRALQIEVTLASEVYLDTCHWENTGVDAGTPAAATAAFSEQTLFEVSGPAKTVLGGYPAHRYDFTLPRVLDLSACSSGTTQFWRDPARDPRFGPTLHGPGEVTVYFVEVGDQTFGVYVFRDPSASTPEMLADLDAVVESLTFEPGG